MKLKKKGRKRMIKFNRNLNKKEIIRAKEVLNEQKNKNNGDYNKSEVIEALKIVFSRKCYICENKNITSYNIEHLRPHRRINNDLKFDWDNLFLACAHCNNIKSGGYINILDCTKIDVDELISFRKKGNFSWEEKIEIIGLNNTKEVLETVDLLNKVYNGTTSAKKLESFNIKKQLREELQNFIGYINEYSESEGEEREDIMFLIKKELKPSSSFTAFKRWIIRDNKDKLKEFLEQDGIKCSV